jgi:two-component sensor histidine kinase
MSGTLALRIAFVVAAITAGLLQPVGASAQESRNCAALVAAMQAGEKIEGDEGAACIAELPKLSAGEQSALLENYLRYRAGFIPRPERQALIEQLAPDAARMLLVREIGSSFEEPGEAKAAELQALVAESQAAGDELSLAYLNYYLGIRSFQLDGDTAAMKEYLLAAQAYGEDNDMVGLLPGILSARGVRAKSDGDYAVAIEIYEEAAERYSAIGSESGRAGTYLVFSNIGNILSDLGDQEAAIRRYNTALAGFRQLETDYDERIALVLLNIANAHSLMEGHSDAVRFYDQARDAAQQGNATYLEGVINFAEAKPLLAFGDRKRAVQLAEQSVDQLREYREPAEAALALNWLAARYLEDQELKKAQAALDQANSLMGLGNGGAEELLAEPGNTYWALEYAKTRGRLLVQMNRRDEASPYLDAALKLSEDRFETEKISAVVNSELLFDVRDRELRLELMEDEAIISDLRLQQSRLWLALAIAFLMLVAGLIYRSYRDQKREAETSRVFLQEIHHRTKNNLQLLISLLNLDVRRGAKSNQPQSMQNDAATRAKTMALVHDHIYAREAPNSTRVEVDEFLDELLVLLEGSLGRSEVQLRWNIDAKELDVNQLTPLGLLVSELVTNSYKHGFNDGGGELEVSFEANSGSFQLRVEDNGSGFTRPIDEGRTDSLGMSLVDDLVEQLDAEKELTTSSDGTCWIIQSRA